MRLKDGYVEPKQEPCDNCNNDVCCCIIRTQETLEEGFDIISKELDFSEFDFASFKLGAKWQQTQDKNKYSDEEVLNLLIECSKWQLPQTDEDLAKIKQWFAEFKKK